MRSRGGCWEPGAVGAGSREPWVLETEQVNIICGCGRGRQWAYSDRGQVPALEPQF
jgi:hypothetical protein